MNRTTTTIRGMTALAAAVVLAACASDDQAAGDSALPAADTAAAIAPPAVDSAPSADSVAPAAPVVPAASAPAAPAGNPPAGGAPARPSRPAPSRPASPAPQQAASADTVRGIIAEVGSMPMTSIVVKPAGGRSVTITGPLAREIGRAAGAELWVSGKRTAMGIEVDRYAVRSVDGQPAVDGTIARDGDRLVLVTTGGRRVIAQPPAALRGMAGARVWLVGSLDGPIAAYGVLKEAP